MLNEYDIHSAVDNIVADKLLNIQYEDYQPLSFQVRDFLVMMTHNAQWQKCKLLRCVHYAEEVYVAWLDEPCSTDGGTGVLDSPVLMVYRDKADGVFVVAPPSPVE